MEGEGRRGVEENEGIRLRSRRRKNKRREGRKRREQK